MEVPFGYRIAVVGGMVGWEMVEVCLDGRLVIQLRGAIHNKQYMTYKATEIKTI